MKFYKWSTTTKEFKTSMRVWVMRKPPMKGGHTHNHKRNVAICKKEKVK